ncbi:MAG: hypothetical protein AB7V14_05980 [Kiritimatiellia bacterium]
MSMDDEVSPENGTQEKPELALDLNFVPTWARKPPENPYAGREGSGEGDRRHAGSRDDRRGGWGRREGVRRPGPRRDGGPAGGGFRRPEAGGRPDSRFPRREGGGGFSGPRREGFPRRDGADRRPPREALPRLDVKVTFLPDRERLALVVRDIQASRRAFPLVEIASRFLGREDSYLVKLELPPPAEGAPRQTFVQCLECKRVFRSRANAEAHVLNDHLDTYFAIEETETEAPSGAFSCVARCGLSGTLLGPPNYHGYNEKIQELWASRFPHMSKAEYLGHVETVRDEALIEQWKDFLRKKTVYRLKETPEGQASAAMTRAEAQDWMRGGKVNPLLRESGRCMLPAAQSRKFDDGALRAAVSAAWQRESRFPLTLLLSLRPAFRHMHLYLFKVNAKETYVTSVSPKPVEWATAPAIVKEIVSFLEAHPGSTRQQVLEGLRSGADPESSQACELLLHLGNLVANGGAIEFFNATLALPGGGARAEAKKEAGGEPAAGDAPAADPGPPADSVSKPADESVAEDAKTEPAAAEPAAAPDGAGTAEEEPKPV